MSDPPAAPSVAPATPPPGDLPPIAKDPAACWNIVGLVAFGLGLFVGIGIFTGEMNGDSLGIGRAIYGGMAFLAGTGVGAVASAIALFRQEQKAHLTVIGLVLNGVPFGIFLTGLIGH